MAFSCIYINHLHFLSRVLYIFVSSFFPPAALAEIKKKLQKKKKRLDEPECHKTCDDISIEQGGYHMLCPLPFQPQDVVLAFNWPLSLSSKAQPFCKWTVWNSPGQALYFTLFFETNRPEKSCVWVCVGRYEEEAWRIFFFAITAQM